MILIIIIVTNSPRIAIFNSGDYPDNTSGGVSEVLISPSTENFIQLTVKSFTSTEAVRSVPKEKRECIFSDEEKVLQANYTYSDCIVDCRAKSIWETCNCRPFSLPRRVKWWSVLPHEVTNPEEVENFERAVEGDGDNLLHCNSCYPACNDVSYYVFNDFVPLQTGYYQSELLDNLEVKDQSIVHIYFINFGSVRLKMDLGYYWYELLSGGYRASVKAHPVFYDIKSQAPIDNGNIGGICGIFIGFSLLSLVELGYFFLGFIYEICCPGKIITEVGNTIEDPGDPGDTERSATDMQSVNRIYWNELLSQPRVGMKNKIVRPRRKLRY
ncbi:hypothetical protein KQX54_020245 [Cotesia glomerata]|uniref:Uncharacterized protein n=1 Tax=Cotesia glomerata TaxID=32391 RepID=A0AAV7I6J7_COTGL|nr:hypothetical protein KQX54_020245 [Cotesia glomerata]